MVAGPSEVSIVADKTADPDFVAADLIAQAEHDVFAQSILISDNKSNRLMAWIFFMLFITALAFFTLVFSILFDDIAPGLALSVSALTTTGPLFGNAGYDIVLTDFNQIFKIMLGLAMIIGRLEILVIVALLFPSVWSK